MPGSKPIPVTTGFISTENVDVIQFDLELILGHDEEFDLQNFTEELATELGIDPSLISVEITSLDEGRRLDTDRQRFNSTSASSPAAGRLKLVVTIQVPQELDPASIAAGNLEATAGLGGASLG